MTHTYKITDLEKDRSTGVVTKVFYTLTTVSGKGEKVNYADEFTVTGTDSDDGFIPYNNLTESDILGWLDANVDKTTIETQTSSSVTNRTGTSTGLPW